MAKQYINELKDNTPVNSFFSVKYKHAIKPYQKGYMFVVGLADKTGEIELTFFGDNNKEEVEEVYNSFESGDVIFVKGYSKVHNGKLKININKSTGELRKANAEEYADEDFIHVTNQDIEEMFGFITKKIENIKNPYLKQLLEYFFKDEEFVKKFKRAPAAMYMHHACVGGLLEHTWGILTICETMKVLHPSLDEDLLVAGAILHDIGKVEEFEITSNIKVSEKGMLLSHVFIGADMVSKAIDKIDGFPEKLRNKILHIIISHHGELEYGALKRPEFPEAAAVALADQMDSQITQYIRIKKDASKTTDDFRTYSKNLGEIYLR
jgi:3'-5' exoribonuclease